MKDGSIFNLAKLLWPLVAIYFLIGIFTSIVWACLPAMVIISVFIWVYFANLDHEEGSPAVLKIRGNSTTYYTPDADRRVTCYLTLAGYRYYLEKRRSLDTWDFERIATEKEFFGRKRYDISCITMDKKESSIMLQDTTEVDKLKRELGKLRKLLVEASLAEWKPRAKDGVMQFKLTTPKLIADLIEKEFLSNTHITAESVNKR